MSTINTLCKWGLRINSVLAFTLIVMMIAKSDLNAASFQDEEKGKVRMDLNYFKLSEDSSYLTVRLLTRKDRQYEPVQGLIINLFLNHQTKSGMMGNVTTDAEGKGIFILPGKFYPAKDTLTSLNFMARLKNDPNYQDKITTLNVLDASLKIHVSDSIKKLTVQITRKDSVNRYSPVEGANIKFHVKRLFSLLPIGEEFNFTDEDGEVSIDFPEDLPGDTLGNLEVKVSLEEDDNYGNIIASKVLPWGSDHLIAKDTFDERTMWSSRDKTPMYMLIFPNLLLIAVWAIIIYLLIQLRKIYQDSGASVN